MMDTKSQDCIRLQYIYGIPVSADMMHDDALEVILSVQSADAGIGILAV